MISPPNAPESNSARVAAASPLPETSTTATSSRSLVAEATMKSPANSVPPAERSADSANHWPGSDGSWPCRWIRSRRSMSIVSPWAPATPSPERR